MKKHSKKKINESLPMIHSVDFRKLTQELWKLCYSNDVEFYDDDVDINVDNEYFMLFTAVTDNAELHGIMTVKGDKLLVELSEYDGKVLDITDSLLSDDIDTIADYIINSAHAKDAAGITEDYNGSFDTTSFIDAVNNFGVSRKQWLDFIENEAKKFIRKKEAVWEKEGWSVEDALVYGLERCDDVSYDGFDITRDEYDGLFNSLVFYIKYKSKNESLQTVNEKYYLTWYTEEEEGGPEEGGWSRRVWDVKKSYPFSSKEEAINYFNNEVVEDGDTVKEFEGGWRIKDGYGDEHLFEIETDATRGQSHEGPRTWDMYEFGYKNPVPKFDSEGNRIYESVEWKVGEKIKHKGIDATIEDISYVKSPVSPGEYDCKLLIQKENERFPRWIAANGAVRGSDDDFEGTGMSEKDIHNLSYDDMKKMGIYESSDGNKDKLVIYKSLGGYKVTPKSNYKAQIQNAREVIDAKDFESAREIIDYYKKYGWADSDDDFEIIDESLNENWCDEKLLELEVKGKDNWDQDDWETYAYCKNANAERDYQEMKDAEYEMEHPYEDMDDYEYWQMENEIPEDDFDLSDDGTPYYVLVDRKTVDDSDGFTTEYSWYKDNNGHNVFVFGDSDLYRPEDEDWDWESYSDEDAKEWFDNYNGFEEEDEENYWE